MKILIVTVALAISSQALAFLVPGPNADLGFEKRTICLSTTQNLFGQTIANSCDEAENNADPYLQRKVTRSGCTDDQVAMVTSRSVVTYSNGKKELGDWEVDLPMCSNPNN